MAAIDFGTTYSGVAYSFRTNKDDIVVVQKKLKAASYAYLSDKMPTTLLIGPDKEAWFGWEAEIKYKELSEDDEHLGYYYFRRFKMELHKSEVRWSKF